MRFSHSCLSLFSRSWWWIVVMFLISQTHAAEFYSKLSPVLQVSSSNFNKLITKSNYVSVVEFFAPWCGHCQNLKPAYENTARSLDGIAQVAALDCDDDLNKPLCGKMGVKSFPTLKIFSRNPKTGKVAFEDYHGARTAKEISAAVADRIPNNVTKLSSKNADAWLDSFPDLAKVILFTKKGTTPVLLRTLAIDYSESIKFAKVRDNERSLVERFHVTQFPSIVLVRAKEKEGTLYESKMKKKEIIEFLSQVGSPNSQPLRGGSKKIGAAPKKSAKAAKASLSAASLASSKTKSKKLSKPSSSLSDTYPESSKSTKYARIEVKSAGHVGDRPRSESSFKDEL